jgi:hypothetical protein
LCSSVRVVAGELDQGLVFAALNQSPEQQFPTVQTRLLGEPMIGYIAPVGGGFSSRRPAPAATSGGSARGCSRPHSAQTDGPHPRLHCRQPLR